MSDSISTCHVKVGRADSLLGSYRTPRGRTAGRRAGWSSSRKATGSSGRNTLVTDGAGRDRLLYRAYEEGQGFVGETPQRPLMLDRLRWEDGWPLLPDRTPGQEAHVLRIE